MRSILIVSAAAWPLASSSIAIAQEQPVEEAKPKDVDARLEALEAEVERLRLQLPDEDEAEADEPQPAPAAAVSPNALNPTVTVVGNGLYRWDDRAVLVDETAIDNRFNLREVELDLRAAVDPFADGVFILALESEVPGEFETGVEEGYVVIKRLPIPVLDEPPLGLQFKVGRFRPEIGRVNVLHLHDLPQMARPLVTEEMFGEEGYVGNGASARVLLPTPFDEDAAVELIGQILTGGGVAVADGPGDSPAAVGNLRWFRSFAEAHNLDLALVFHFGRTDPGGDKSAFTWGADALYKWKPLRRGEYRSFVVGGQALASQRDFDLAIDTDGDGEPDLVEDREAAPFGYFAFAQVQTTRTTYLGARWDDTATIVDDAVRRRGIGGYAAWYVSEFLRFRLGYEHRLSDLEEEDGRDSIFAEVNVVIGAHPPEPFWVNK